MVAGIETPNAYLGKNNIPDYKEYGRQNYSRKNSFPPFYIPHPAFKTIYKWNQ
jgi:hypothetical protein